MTVSGVQNSIAILLDFHWMDKKSFYTVVFYRRKNVNDLRVSMMTELSFFYWALAFVLDVSTKAFTGRIKIDTNETAVEIQYRAIKMNTQKFNLWSS